MIRDGENIIKKKYDEPNSGNKSRIKKKKRYNQMHNFDEKL